MGSFESFYGGRQGASFVIVHRFDAVSVPEDKPQEFKRKIYAVESEQVEEKYVYCLDSNSGELIERNSLNYDQYAWQLTELNGVGVQARVHDTDPISTYTLERKEIETMVDCFKQGGDTTNLVNYGEYVLIDTITDRGEFSNPDNGKVYRRGINYDYNATTNPLCGAEYIGQIIGPQGETPQLDIKHYLDVKNITSHHELDYSESLQDMVPGKYKDNGDIVHYNDDLKWAYATLQDEFGNIKGCTIGFQLPYLTPEITNTTRSSYYTRDDYDNGRISDETLIGMVIKEEHNFDLFIDNGEDTPDRDPNHGDTGHPFYRKWKIEIPKGIKGDSLSELKIFPTIVVAGSQVIDVDSGLTYTTSEDMPITISSYWDDFRAGHVIVEGEIDDHEGRFQASLEDTADLHYGYLFTWFDEYNDGRQHQWFDIGPYKVIERTSLSADGWLSVYYTSDYKTPEKLAQALRWIWLESDPEKTKGVEMAEDGTVTIWYNTLDEHDQHEFQQYENILVWIDETILNREGHFKVTYNNETLYDGEYPYSKGNPGWSTNGSQASWETDLTWPTQVSLTNAGVLKFLYNNNLLDDIYPEGEPIDGTVNRVEGSYSFILPWLIQTKLLSDGHFNFKFNNDRLYDSEDPDWDTNDHTLYKPQITWASGVKLLNDGHFNFKYNNDKLYDPNDSDWKPSDHTIYQPQITWSSGVKLLNDGHFNFKYNNDKLYDSEDSDWDNTHTIYQPQITWPVGVNLLDDGHFNFEYNNDKLYDSENPNWDNTHTIFQPQITWVTKVSLDNDGRFKLYFNNDLNKAAVKAAGGTWNDADHSYEKQIAWVANVEIGQDGVVTFINSNGTSVASSNPIKCIENVWIDTGDTEGTGDQQIHIQYNIISSETGQKEISIIGNPINYIVESIVSAKDNLYNVEPNHLLVWYSDPIYRGQLKQQYPDRVFTYKGTKDTSAKDGWFDLGYIKGEPGGIHIIGNVSSIDDLYNDGPAHTNPKKPEDIGGTDCKGWVMTVQPVGADTPSIFAFDYIQNDWYYLGDTNSTLYDPKTIIDIDSTANPPLILNTDGVWMVQDRLLNNNVITQVRRKNSDNTYDTYQLSPKQRYCEALSASNNGNLEEQLLLGTDKIIKIWHDDTNNIDMKRIEFRRSTDTENYYVLIISKYCEDNVLVQGNEIIFTTDDDLTRTPIVIEPVVSEIQELKYVSSVGTETLISTKTITRQADEDGKIIITEQITRV